ncbi:MAG: cell division protein FtsL [Lachnospiraceae bacterium]|nr:cell division protein FtsL [Lachnospiraceae bacterium]
MASYQGRRQVSGGYAHQRQTTYARTYIEGNTARQLDVRRAIEEEPRKRLSQSTRKNREKASHMSLGYVIFLIAALLVSGYILINYIQMQFEITDQVKQIATLESQLNELRMENDESYAKLTRAIDLEEIKRVAIGELGMNYAAQGQIITYTNEGSDYVRQYADIPE